MNAEELKPGLRLNHGTYERVKGELLRTAKNEGYLDAQLTRHDLVIDRFERRATVAIEVATGELYRFGKITTVQNVITDDAMRRLLRMREGDPYTLDALLRTQYVLDDSQYFTGVDIDTDNPDPATRTVSIRISAQPNRKHRYAASLGYATDTGERGKFTWDDRSRQRARASLQAGAHLFLGAEGDFRALHRSGDGRRAGKSRVRHRGERGRAGRYVEQTYRSWRLGLTQVLGRWQRVLFLSLSNDRTTLPATATEPESTDEAFLIIPGISFATLPSYVLGGKVRPYSVYAELKGSPSSFGSDASFLQFRAQVERIYNLSELWDLRIRAELGTSWVADFSDLPSSQRFFAGGDRSVRGFALNELSPKDSLGDGVGGRHLFTGTLELERSLPRAILASRSSTTPATPSIISASRCWSTRSVASLGTSRSRPSVSMWRSRCPNRAVIRACICTFQPS